MLVQGATGKLYMTLSNSVGPMNLTGTVISFIFRRNEFEPSETKTCSIIDAAAGRCNVVLTPEDMSDDGTYYYQIKVAYGDGTVIKSEMVSFYVEAAL